MKAQIHPKWYSDAKIVCACGNEFTLGLTIPELRIDVCYNCHPFYTGQMKYLDTAGRVDAFKARQAAVGAKTNISKTEKRKLKRLKRLQEELEKPTSIEELRSKKKNKS